MQINQTKIKFIFPFLSVFFLSGLLMTGCTQNRLVPSKQETISAASNRYQPQREKNVPVIRYGRYRLVEVGATSEQRALLNQIIDLNIPLTSNNKITVTQGLNYLLLNSGYRLCSSQSIESLSRFELPIAHYRLGPIRLQEALEVLVGNAWVLDVDDRERTVCFKPINTLIDVQINKEIINETR